MNQPYLRSPGIAPPLDRLADWYVSTLPTPSHRTQRLLGNLYAKLLIGSPVSVDELAGSKTTNQLDVVDNLEGWVLFDSQGHIDSGYGVTLRSTQHQVHIGGVSIFAFCAWDAVFLPLLLRKNVTLATTCSVSGTSINIVVAPDGIRAATPARCVLTFATPRSMLSAQDTDTALQRRLRKEQSIRQFCCSVRLFCRPSYAHAWLGNRGDIYVLSLEEAFALATQVHERIFPSLLSGQPVRAVRWPKGHLALSRAH